MVLSSQLKQIRFDIQSLANIRQRAADYHDWDAVCEINDQLEEYYHLERAIVSRIALKQARDAQWQSAHPEKDQ